MASVFALLEAFKRKEAAALGFFPCATASFFYLLSSRYHSRYFRWKNAPNNFNESNDFNENDTYFTFYL